jgi:FkbM family methyltransferase
MATKGFFVPLFNKNDPDLFYVQGRHGTFVVNRHDCYMGVSLIVYGEYSDAEWALFSRFIPKDAVVADIGANIGVFSIPMARRVGEKGRVLCFDAQPYACQLLQLNAQLNHLNNVQIFPCGLGARDEMREIEGLDYTRDGNFGGACFLHKGTGLRASFKKFDDVFQETRLDFLKIDVEGMEIDVLRGAHATLQRFRPALYMENHPGEHAAELIRTLLALGYRMWWHTPYYYNPDNFMKQTENLFEGQLSVNMLCVPMERVDLLRHVPPGLLAITEPEDDIRQNSGIRLSLAG